MKHFTPRELNEVRLHIAQICHIPSAGILLNSNGHFEIPQLKETDKNMILNALRSDESISDVSIFSSGYDFGRMRYPGLPSQKYTITGLVHVSDIDDDMSHTIF